MLGLVLLLLVLCVMYVVDIGDGVVGDDAGVSVGDVGCVIDGCNGGVADSVIIGNVAGCDSSVGAVLGGYGVVVVGYVGDGIGGAVGVAAVGVYGGCCGVVVVAMMVVVTWMAVWCWRWWWRCCRAWRCCICG